MNGDPEGLDELLAQMQQLQAELAEAEASTAQQGVIGTSGGGAVRIRLSGEFSFDAVDIDPAVVAGGDAALLEDLVLAALRDGAAQLLELRKRAMGDAVGNALNSLLDPGQLGMFFDQPGEPEALAGDDEPDADDE